MWGTPPRLLDDDIIFDELQPPEDHDFLVDSSEDDDVTLTEPTELSSKEDENSTSTDADDDNQGISFLPHPNANDDTRTLLYLRRDNMPVWVL